MNLQQILEQLLNFSLQQHAAKDQTIDGLQKQIAELQKQLAAAQPQSASN